ncbi:MAG TPA: hypothetical protein VEO01_19205 [Pseudonocardiaceae bacterium]|nr:hypothetical protein [Pseudonocardiaceae bacterium]
MTEPSLAVVERAYQDRTLLRLLAMRRTMFVVSAGLSTGQATSAPPCGGTAG